MIISHHNLSLCQDSILGCVKIYEVNNLGEKAKNNESLSQTSVFASSFENLINFNTISNKIINYYSENEQSYVQVSFGSMYFSHKLISSHKFLVLDKDYNYRTENLDFELLEMINCILKSHREIDWKINSSDVSNLILHIFACPFCVHYSIPFILAGRPDLKTLIENNKLDWSLMNWLKHYGLKELKYSSVKSEDIKLTAKELVINQIGVNVISHFNNQLGLSDAANNFVNFLTDREIKVTKFPIEAGSSIRKFDEIDKKHYHTFDSQKDFKSVSIFVLGLDTIAKVSERFQYVFLDSEEVGAFIFWELDFLNIEMIECLGQFNFLIVPNEKMKGILKKIYFGKIFIIPTKLSKEKIEGTTEIGKKLYGFEYFLSIFDFNSDLDRKNIIDTIECFHTFKKLNTSKNKLVIKAINGSSHLDQKMKLQQYINNDPDILFIDESWTELEMRMLLNNCKALISIHRAEGFGLNIFNALESGIPCIATKYGGNVEYMKGYPLLVGCNLISIDNFKDSSYQKMFSKENEYTTVPKWADPDKDKVVKFMTQICKDKEFYNHCVNAGYLSLESYRKMSNKNIDELIQYIKKGTMGDKSLTILNKIKTYFL